MEMIFVSEVSKVMILPEGGDSSREAERAFS